MSIPQVQYQLSGRPTLLAGSDWAFLNRRPITTACRPIAFAAFACSADVLHPGVIGGNLIFSMSTSRDAFLGHACVSPAGVEDHSTPDRSDECSSAVAQIRKGKPGR